MKTFSRITDSVFTHARGKTVLAWAIPTTGVYCTMLLWSIPELERFSGGMKTLDMLPTGYDAAYARTLFDALGADGRNFYLYCQIPLDLLYPGLMGITGALLLAWLSRKIPTDSTRWQWLALIPIVAGLCDYLENVGIITMLLRYPDLSLAGLTNLFSLAKSLVSTLFFVTAIAGAVTAFVNRLRSRRATV